MSDNHDSLIANDVFIELPIENFESLYKRWEGPVPRRGDILVIRYPEGLIWEGVTCEEVVYNSCWGAVVAVASEHNFGDGEEFMNVHKQFTDDGWIEHEELMER